MPSGIDKQILEATLPYMTPEELAEVDRLLAGAEELLWKPNEGRQTEAYWCLADELYYGGAAFGGKTQLLLGLAVTAHLSSIIFRREYSQLVGAKGIIEESREILEGKARFNSTEHIWRGIPGNRVLEFGSCQYEHDKEKYKGRAHDFVGFDEVCDMTESQYLFLTGWARTTVTGQRVRVVACGNPPSRPEGEWVKRRWGAWLREDHPNPAKPGELRWYARVDDRDIEVKDGRSFRHNGETIYPRSRTFIPALLKDNPFLIGKQYEAVLQGLPEPLRSQLLFGDFRIGVEDDPWQIIPTEWIRLAQRRWEVMERPKRLQTVVGVDPSRGGDDETVISRRNGVWFDNLLRFAGKSVPDGPAVATLVGNNVDRKGVPIHVDIIGIGSSVYDTLISQGYNVTGVNVAGKSIATDRSGKLTFRNMRAELYWRLREALDPEKGDGLALPTDSVLLADLCAATWRMTPSGVQVEGKEDIKKRLGRSPDSGEAMLMTFYPIMGDLVRFI